MLAHAKRLIPTLLDHALVTAALVSAATLMMAVAVRDAHSAELVPSIGLTRALDGSEETKMSYGLALRSNIAPVLAAEIGASYRKETLYAGTTEIVQWPVTASLWLKPLSAIYAGGGVGWYQTTVRYPQTTLASSTSQKFGAHLGGGLTLPLVPGVASLDLSGRYVYLGDQASELPPRNFKADFWTTSAGLAIHF